MAQRGQVASSLGVAQVIARFTAVTPPECCLKWRCYQTSSNVVFDMPVNNYAELIKYLKANPGKVTFASPGNGTIGHMWGELVKSTTNTFMVHIPYRGAGPALNDVVAGQVNVYFDQVAPSLPFIQSGKLRAIAVSWGKRLEVLPNVPTYGELALFSNNDPSWFGLVAPAGTPAASNASTTRW